MIYLFWISNIFLALFIGFLIRKLFSNEFFKRISFAAFLSPFITFWYLYPGNQDMAPVLTIYLMDLFESENFLQMRLIRPLTLVFILILLTDFLILRFKTKKK